MTEPLWHEQYTDADHARALARLVADLERLTPEQIAEAERMHEQEQSHTATA